jgi:hypothetical protein
MTTIIGRRTGAGARTDRATTGESTCRLGRHLARDGSAGGAVEVDLARPHAACVVGKRGAGKSYTLGVVAEGLCRAPGVVPVVADPMGAFDGLAATGATVRAPRVRAAALPSRAWPGLVGLDPAGGPGSLVWRVATERDTLAAMRSAVAEADASADVRRAAGNALALAASWEVFDPDGFAAPRDPTVLSLSGVPSAAAGAAVRVVAAALYEARVDGDGPLPWLLVDEAHAFVDGVAWPAVERLLTRGRAPGVSVVLATQRPGALPAVARSQADLLVAHRLSGRADREALADARPSFVTGPLVDRLPTATGEALVFDDATERAHAVRVRERRTPHGGDAALAGE